MSNREKCKACGRQVKTASDKAIGFTIGILNVGACSWAFFLLHPWPLRAWFAFLVLSTLGVAMAKTAAQS
jgi:uncharacterized protein (DUF983 family)